MDEIISTALDKTRVPTRSQHPFPFLYVEQKSSPAVNKASYPLYYS
ncbi:hypothetical protein [Brevibacillus laterosporus]|nr:hypothetical protein [Brevibacillus laterosporus]